MEKCMNYSAERCIDCLHKRLEKQKDVNKTLLRDMQSASERTYKMLLVSLVVTGFVVMFFSATLAIRGMSSNEYNVTSEKGNSTISEGLQVK